MVDFRASFDAWRKIGLRQQQNEHYASALIELKQRVKALEDAQQPPAPAATAATGSLVERVAAVIGVGAESINWEPEASAAIHVIAGELRAQCFVHAADWLEQEANRG